VKSLDTKRSYWSHAKLIRYLDLVFGDRFCEVTTHGRDGDRAVYRYCQVTCKLPCHTSPYEVVTQMYSAIEKLRDLHQAELDRLRKEYPDVFNHETPASS